MLGQEDFGSSQLNDIRRTGQAVKAAKRKAENPSATLAAHMQTWKETMAVYRLLDEENVTFEALMQPHWHQTREQIETRRVMLRVPDTTEVDLSHHPCNPWPGSSGQRARTTAVCANRLGSLARNRGGAGLCDAGAD